MLMKAGCAVQVSLRSLENACHTWAPKICVHDRALYTSAFTFTCTLKINSKPCFCVCFYCAFRLTFLRVVRLHSVIRPQYIVVIIHSIISAADWSSASLALPCLNLEISALPELPRCRLASRRLRILAASVSREKCQRHCRHRRSQGCTCTPRAEKKIGRNL